MVYFNEKLEKLKEFLILSGRVLSYEPFFLCVNYSFRSIMLVIKISKKEILYSLFIHYPFGALHNSTDLC